MAKRTAAFFSVFVLCAFLLLMNVYTISTGSQLAETADQQSTYQLTVAATRGTIYDCNMSPFTGTESEIIAAISPTIEAAAALSQALSQDQMEQVYPMLTQGNPFLLKLEQPVYANGIDIFEVDKRYAGDSQLATTVIGYLDGSGKGIAGIERAYDEYLSQEPGEISIFYKVDAVNRVLQGEGKELYNTYDQKNRGVVLTLDKEIQALAENAAKKYLVKGAVVVTEAPTGAVRALVSVPGYSPGNIAAALEDENSPMINRAFSAYNVGSVFKLISAAAALENGVCPQASYDCTGGIEIGGGVFHCFNGESHGTIDMQEAVAKSCNAYFVHLMQQVPNESFLGMAQALGFGEEIVFAPGYSSVAGNLPTLQELLIPRALANFSFGQGSLLATPIQISGLINAIAAKGEYSQPYLVEGLVDENRQLVKTVGEEQPERVMSQTTAALLRQFMGAAVDHGTGQKGKPSVGGAGAKTGTAQTGIFVDGNEVVQAWYAGFYPLNDPKYSIVVLAEDGGSSSTCAPVFREISDGLFFEKIVS